jgi:hypothetical protein
VRATKRKVSIFARKFLRMPAICKAYDAAASIRYNSYNQCTQGHQIFQCPAPGLNYLKRNPCPCVVTCQITVMGLTTQRTNLQHHVESPKRPPNTQRTRRSVIKGWQSTEDLKGSIALTRDKRTFPIRDLLRPVSPAMQSLDVESIISALLAATNDSARRTSASGPFVQARVVVSSLLGFHQRVQEGSADRRDAISFWASFVSRGGLDPLFAFSDAAGGDVVGTTTKLFEFCCSFAKSNSDLQVKLSGWIPKWPHHMLRVFEDCIQDSGG